MEIKWKAKNTTPSEQFQIPAEKQKITTLAEQFRKPTEKKIPHCRKNSKNQQIQKLPHRRNN